MPEIRELSEHPEVMPTVGDMCRQGMMSEDKDGRGLACSFSPIANAILKGFAVSSYVYEM